MPMLKRSRILLVCFATLVSAIYLSADSEPLDRGAEHGAKRVRVAGVEATSDTRELRFSGVTRAARHARLAFSIGGRVISRPIKVGDQVKKGQILARLDGRELANAIATAKGTLGEVAARRAQVERDVERTQRLVDAKAATEEELERSRAGLDAVRAAEETGQARLRETERLAGENRLTAPYSGTVTEIFFETGEHAGPGQPVVTLSGDGDLELEVEVPESTVPRIQEGGEVQVSLPLMDRTVIGNITSVGRTAAGRGRLFPVVATISETAAKNNGIVIGATAELALRLESENALSVPVEAVVNPGGRRPALFRTTTAAGETKAQKIQVEVGALLGNRVVVRAGDLAVGDLVVVGGQRGLLDGEVVDLEATKLEAAGLEEGS